ncbi:MAG: hypothetical protein ACLQQ4_01435 [Bacteroidia bacterium]
MKTFEIFNNRDLTREWIKSVVPRINLDIAYAINIKYGILSSSLMALSVSVLKHLVSKDIMFLPLFVIPFLAGGIILSIRDYGYKSGKMKLEYFTGLENGFITTVMAVNFFALFMLWYFSSPEFNAVIFNPVISAGALWMVLIALGAVTTFSAMQYYKGYSFNKQNENGHE